MLKTIAAVSPGLSQFVDTLKLPLNKPQHQHVTQIADGLITTQGSKTLSALYRHIVGDPCPKSAADTFREAPWQADALRTPLRRHLTQAAFETAETQGAAKQVFLSLDDSLTAKDNGSKRLQAVDWHVDHTQSWSDHPAYTKGAVYVLLRLTIGNVSFTVDMVPYLRAKTVRQLNRARSKEERLTFHTKIQIAKAMLEAVKSLIPDGYSVYLLCDSWYAAASLIGWCRDQEWHVICRLKSNRNLDDVQVRQHHQRHKHRPYTRVRVRAADGKRAKTYLVRSLTGKLSNLSEDVRVFISQRHSGDSYPRYYCCTDLSLSADDALNGFLKRWSCEVANWYIAERLGWADCRLWRVEAVEKFLMVLWLALAYLEYRQVTEAAHTNLADVIRSHRQDHALRLLTQACTMALQKGDVSQVLARYTLAPVPT
jgi:hypothetical protein